MKRFLRLALILVLLALTAPAGVSCATSASKESYKVGAVFAVTGFNSPLGTPEKQTVEMMAEQINAKGGINGHKLEVIVYDTTSDATECVKLVKRLIEQDKVLAVIGPNGAGKTTLFNIITGVFPPSRGKVLFDGKPLNGIPASDRVKLGIARTFQQVYLFREMTVLENIMSGRYLRTRTGFLSSGMRLPQSLREEEEILLDADRFLNMVEQGRQKDMKASQLPLGQQKLVAIGRALATEPKLLLLDEPGAGLNAIEKRGLSELIKRIRDMGITVVLVEHDMELVMGTADSVVVLICGQKISEGTPGQVQRDKRVIAAYLGEDR